MLGYVDLHCHWIAGIDDGARTPEEGVAMLRGLYGLGFSTIMATPHMRPGMFDNDRVALERAYAAMQPYLDVARTDGPLPAVHLASEHFFDDIVFQRLLSDAGLPYPSFASLTLSVREPAAPPRSSPLPAPSGSVAPTKPASPGTAPHAAMGAVLVELPPQAFPARLAHRFFDLKKRKLSVVLAHPERYRPVWENDECLTPLLDAGAHLLLDVLSLVGRYGKAAQSAAEKLLDEDAYEAACTDSHKPSDVPRVREAIVRLQSLVGKEESFRLLSSGPLGILDGGERA
jgi:protein-tyrosine phosphatase